MITIRIPTAVEDGIVKVDAAMAGKPLAAIANPVRTVTNRTFRPPREGARMRNIV
jgi:hypothetical protein